MCRILSRYETWAPNALVVVRGDSGFANPDLFELVEAKRHQYVILLTSNACLQSIAQTLADSFLILCNLHKREVDHWEFMCEAASWKKARGVLVKMERPAKELLLQFTFMVTKMTLQPKNVVRFYYPREHMENFIKEAKNGFVCDKMSSTDVASNAVKLQVAMLAYHFNN